jgi:lambda family phage tail tape measure protein
MDQLAAGYAAAGLAAEQAADKILEVQEASQRGAQAVSDVFFAMASGAMTAKQALGQLILQMLKMAMQKRIMEMAEGGGFIGNAIGFVGKALSGGFADGGYTGDGGKHQPAGVVHKGEFVLSKAATSAIGVGNLNALHASALKGYSGGGLVGNGPKGITPASRDAAPTVTISAPITVNGSAGTPEQNDDLARKMAREMENSMRGAVQTELRKQMRPGNMLNSGKR